MQLLHWIDAHVFVFACLGLLVVAALWALFFCLQLGREITRDFFGRP